MSPSRYLLLLLFILAVFGSLYWLTTRPDYVSPEGTQVYGPQEAQSGMNITLTFTVRWPEGQLRSGTDFLHGVARQAVVDAGSGEYTVRFLEQGSERQITSYRFSSVGDILFSTRVTELP